jgi:hypothetical protein
LLHRKEGMPANFTLPTAFQNLPRKTSSRILVKSLASQQSDTRHLIVLDKNYLCCSTHPDKRDSLIYMSLLSQQSISSDCGQSTWEHTYCKIWENHPVAE